MPSFYLTFGQIHEHEIGGVVFDKDCVAKLESSDYLAARDLAFEIFNDKWCFIYNEQDMLGIQMKYFPRGIIEVPDGYQDQQHRGNRI